MVVTVGHYRVSLPDNTDDRKTQIGEQCSELSQLRIEDRAIILATHADQPQTIVSQRNHLE